MTLIKTFERDVEKRNRPKEKSDLGPDWNWLGVLVLGGRLTQND